MQYCKLVKEDLTTYRGFQWKVGEWQSLTGEPLLCTDTVFHFYYSPILAALFAHILHVPEEYNTLYEVEVEGDILEDITKLGCQKLRLVGDPIELPQFTRDEVTGIWLQCSLSQEHNNEWSKFVDDYTKGLDRSQDTWDSNHKNIPSAIKEAGWSSSLSWSSFWSSWLLLWWYSTEHIHQTGLHILNLRG